MESGKALLSFETTFLLEEERVNPRHLMRSTEKRGWPRSSRRILHRISSEFMRPSKFNQWKNTASAIEWFKSIKNKKHLSFICFDIVEFYPSISQDLLNKALDFAFSYDNITMDERNVIIHAKKSTLIHKQQPWQKKGDTTFDVTMGSYDGAETCELVGSCFLLSQLQDLNINVGLYRDQRVSSPTNRSLILKSIRQRQRLICLNCLAKVHRIHSHYNKV